MTTTEAVTAICTLLDSVQGFTVSELGAIQDRLRKLDPKPNRGGPKRGKACARNHPGKPSVWTQITLKKRSGGKVVYYDSAHCLTCRAAQREKTKIPLRCRKNHPDIRSRFIERPKADGTTWTDCLECRTAIYHHKTERLPVCWSCNHKMKLHREGVCEHRDRDRKFDCDCTRSRR